MRIPARSERSRLKITPETQTEMAASTKPKRNGNKMEMETKRKRKQNETETKTNEKNLKILRGRGWSMENGQNISLKETATSLRIVATTHTSAVP